MDVTSTHSRVEVFSVLWKCRTEVREVQYFSKMPIHKPKVDCGLVYITACLDPVKKLDKGLS